MCLYPELPAALSSGCPVRTVRALGVWCPIRNLSEGLPFQFKLFRREKCKPRHRQLTFITPQLLRPTCQLGQVRNEHSSG